jgi:hypothetical protein
MIGPAAAVAADQQCDDERGADHLPASSLGFGDAFPPLAFANCF